MKDRYGNLLFVGDMIVYAVKRSSSVDLIPARITQERGDSIVANAWNGEATYRVTLRAEHNIIKVHGIEGLII
jgi:hypothetical protein